MLSWQLDRLLRAGPLCALATFAMPAAMAIVIAARSSVDNVLGMLVVSAGLILVGTLVGSTLTTAGGIALFGTGAVVAETSTIGLVLVGSGLFVTLIVHDLAGSFRRAPAIHRSVALDALLTGLAVCVAGGALFGLAYTVATLTLWQAIVFPFGIASIGFAAKLAADAHQRNVRRR